MAENLNEEFDWFINNHREIFEKYPNTFLVIKDKEIKFAADTFDEALMMATCSGLKLGTFIIQECSEGNDSYTQDFINYSTIFA